VIAEQFGTLESLYPGASIWVSAGTGSDQRTAQAAAQSGLRSEGFRGRAALADYFSAEPRQAVRAVPGGLNVRCDPGSSLFGAEVAAALGCLMLSPRISHRLR